MTVDRLAVRARSGGRCEVRWEGCTGAAVVVHHRKLRSQGGGDTLANLCHCCVQCHSAVHASPTAGYRSGFLVHGWDDPEAIPMGMAA